MISISAMLSILDGENLGHFHSDRHFFAQLLKPAIQTDTVLIALKSASLD